ncbi:MAG: hypothetical protein A4E53_02650 [Pelotomaculum sp. PtaB.Bin104]|nr:MAG: hypothetical protein A4E53_02650 [Pelotomaculum sp. PtaB.Bin104]
MELGFVGPIFIGIIFMLLITGMWIYNATQTSQAARLAAHQLAVTGNYSEAYQIAYSHLGKTGIGLSSEEVSVYWSGDVACAQVITNMETYMPGLVKLFNPSGTNWTGKVTISRGAQTTGEYRLRSGNQSQFN